MLGTRHRTVSTLALSCAFESRSKDIAHSGLEYPRLSGRTWPSGPNPSCTPCLALHREKRGHRGLFFSMFSAFLPFSPRWSQAPACRLLNERRNDCSLSLVQGSMPVMIGQDGCALTYNLNWVSGADGESRTPSETRGHSMRLRYQGFGTSHRLVRRYVGADFSSWQFP